MMKQRNLDSDILSGDETYKLPEVYNGEAFLKTSAQRYRITLVICHSPDSGYYPQMQRSLHKNERQYYETLRFEKRKNSYLLGRYSAKKALVSSVNGVFLNDIFIQPGVFSQPVTRFNSEHNIQVSITHCENIGAAIAFPETHPMGIDIENATAQNINVLEGQMSKQEKSLTVEAGQLYCVVLNVLWTAKEALSKALKIGFSAPVDLYEISVIKMYESHILGFFKNFTQFKFTSFCMENYVCSIVYPVYAELEVDIKLIQRHFYSLKKILILSS